ncbi:MAG TPA: putative N-acetylmannosamine-6-phosphate 2-epimerase [Amaricoccus sp.]|nr:putative N-acetylmannosamine-6-phosphate 2-epimerase [Amaricoccus sp.]
MSVSPGTNEVVSRLRGKLVVSCQPVPNGPLDTVEAIVAYGLAAEAAGAAGLRIECARNVAAVAAASTLPVIGLIKRDLADSAVRITPYLADVEALLDAGAAVVAVDATDRPRPVPSAALLAAIKRRGAVAMADISTGAEARAAIAAGADIVGTTMSGYTGPGPTPAGPDLGLVGECATLGAPVLAEGRYNAPALAAAAMRAGATAVVVGSAITRPEHIVGWFRAAVEAAALPERPALAFDIGGSKTLAALVRGREVLDRRMVATARDIGAPGWVDGVAGMAADWSGAYGRVAAAVTGAVVDGGWSPLNPGTLAIPPGFPLGRRLGEALGTAVAVVNDAQAAAWGEYRFGAGRGRDMVFLTVSSGIGGGIVLGGRLLRGARGIAGSLGQVPWPGGAGFVRLETLASGFGIATAARAAGREADAKAVFAAARAGERWADGILVEAAGTLAAAVAGLQAVVDPDCVVIGGGVGLAEGFLERLGAALGAYPSFIVPALARAELGGDAGIIGVANLAD